MSSYAVRTRSSSLALACTALLALAACERIQNGEPATELAWARAALERNPQLEVVATDTQSQVFTVRNRNTGEVQTVKLSDLAAAPVSQLPVTAAAPAVASTAARPVDSATSSTPGIAAESDVEETEETGELSAAAAESPAESNYTIERTGDQVKVSGPGVSIVSTGRSAASGPQGEAGLRTVEPIICEGRRMIHFDNRNIYVDGDAITVRGGCEMFITNSRIVASGTGVVVQDAVVHVSNSHIEGASRSFQAADEAKMYVRGSTFEGLSQRDALAMVQDQGGNRWR